MENFSSGSQSLKLKVSNCWTRNRGLRSQESKIQFHRNWMEVQQPQPFVAGGGGTPTDTNRRPKTVAFVGKLKQVTKNLEKKLLTAATNFPQITFCYH